MTTTTQGYLSAWPIELRALGGRKMSWEYEHLAEGDNDIMLFDSETGEEIATANDNYLVMNKELPYDAVHEAVVTGTAALSMLMHLMRQDLVIAGMGPEGAGLWREQVPGWWENEEETDEVVDEDQAQKRDA
ncbi:hypothetical protein R3P38DRAFT_9265 [Favolaschia claudopus]|uniref:Uncharacterized protein n=1 Tax=Favolaschia claudopus TaxID=2862362 RepID=A0AAW0EG76_9AGAR